MDLDNIYNFSGLMSVGSPNQDNIVHENEYTEEERSYQDKKYKEALKRYKYWFMGMLVSFISVSVIPLVMLFTGVTTNFTSFVTSLFCQSEILFIGVSIAISADNDATSNNDDQFWNRWHWIAIILVLFGAVCYAILEVLEYFNQSVSEVITTWTGLIFFFMTFTGGSVPYLKSITDSFPEYKKYNEEDDC